MVSTGIIFPTAYMCIQYYIHPPMPFPHLLFPPTAPTSPIGPVSPSYSLIL
jgi:hypothetical protein